MGSVVYYCCIWKGGRVLFRYNKGSSNNSHHGSGEIEDLAALCLEMTPPYHKWYVHTMGRKAFGFLTEEDDDGFTYFAIVDHSIGKSRLLRFLHALRVESTKRMMNTDRPWNILPQERLTPVVDHLVASLEHANADEAPWFPYNDFTTHYRPPYSSSNDDAEGGGGPTRGDKRKEKKAMKEHVIAVTVRGDHIEMEEHCQSTQARGSNSNFVRLAESDDNQEASSSSSTAHPKDFSSSKIVSNSQQSLHQKWCRQARIVFAINVAVCIVLFVVWLAICHGMECIH